jgi:hypothetical protein
MEYDLEIDTMPFQSPETAAAGGCRCGPSCDCAACASRRFEFELEDELEDERRPARRKLPPIRPGLLRSGLGRVTPSPRLRPPNPRPGPWPNASATYRCQCPEHRTEFVRWVQSSLNRALGMRLGVSGLIDAETRRAIRAFQARQGLREDGIVGPDTELALRTGNGQPQANDADRDTSELELDAADLEEEFSLAALPEPVRTAMRGGKANAEQAVRLAIQAGITSQDTLADIGFYAAHPERLLDGIGAPIRRDEPQFAVLASEWKALLAQARRLLAGTDVGPASGAVAGPLSDRWVLPEPIRLAADGYRIATNPEPPWAGIPGNCRKTHSPGALKLKEFLQAKFQKSIWHVGTLECRPSHGNPINTSMHGVGRALDLHIKRIGKRANSTLGDPIANWLVQNAEALGVQYVIWNHMRWSAYDRLGPRFDKYNPKDKHTDHIHVELNKAGSEQKTPWFKRLQPTIEDPAGNIQSAASPLPNKWAEIIQAATSSAAFGFRWRNRGWSPAGYLKGMALVYARVYCKLKAGDSVVTRMAAASSGDVASDALAHFAPEFLAAGMSNSRSGVDTLRHLFVLLIGLGMRESSGRYCAGRDRGADNTDADTAEAGLFQTSFNTRSAGPLLPVLFQHYRARPAGFIEVFKEGVRCRDGDLVNHGAGDGREFQRLSKACPAFAAEYTALALRHRAMHWGPIKHKTVEIRPECDELLLTVQAIVDQGGVCAARE